MWKLKQKVTILITLSLLILLPSCTESSDAISMDDWVALSLNNAADTVLEMSLPPELAENKIDIDMIDIEDGWSAYYYTEHSDFQMYVSITENSAGYSEELLHTLMGSDIRYMSENMFDEMQISSFLSAPESEKGEKTIHDKDWKYYSLSGSSKKKHGGSVAACEYAYVKDTDIVQVIVLYSAKNGASEEEKSLLDQWYKLIPETMEVKDQAE